MQYFAPEYGKIIRKSAVETAETRQWIVEVAGREFPGKGIHATDLADHVTQSGALFFNAIRDRLAERNPTLPWVKRTLVATNSASIHRKLGSSCAINDGTANWTRRLRLLSLHRVRGYPLAILDVHYGKHT